MVGRPQIFIAPGNEKNIRRSVEEGVRVAEVGGDLRDRVSECYGDRVYLWGVSKERRGSWELVREGDVVVFYVGGTVGRAVWCARVLFKGKSDNVSKTVWDSDRWPYLLFLTSPVKIAQLELTRSKLIEIGIPISGFARVEKGADKLWEIISTLCGGQSKCGQGTAANSSPHVKVQEMLVKLGRMWGFDASKEHSWEQSHRFDVVYFNRHRRYPIAVFEVHRAGNEYKDLAAFKNVLNSYGEATLLFYVLVGDFERKRSQIETEIGRSFPELKDRLALISAEDVKRLYDLLKSSTASQLLERLMKKLVG